MLRHENNTITSIEQLISALDHVEESELKSDIRQNVRAEMRRIKRNVSSVLAFTAHSRLSSPATAELEQALMDLRRECIAINGTISRFLILQALHAERWFEYSSRVIEQYAAMSDTARRMCSLAAPLRTQELATAL